MHWLLLLTLISPRGTAAPLTPGPSPVRPVRIAARAALLATGTFPLQRATWDRRTGPDLEPAPLPIALAPEGLLGMESRYVSARPAAGALLLGDPGTAVPFILDESFGSGRGYDRLILDLNLDGDLSDPPVTGRLRRIGEFQCVDFECAGVPAVYGDADGERLERVRVLVHGHRLGQGDWRFDYRLGEVRMGEIPGVAGPVRVVLADGAMRAAYNRRSVYHSAVATDAAPGPQVWLSPDPRASGAAGPLHLTLGAAQLLGDQLFVLEPSPNGDMITVRPYDSEAVAAQLVGANSRREPLDLTELLLLGTPGRYELDAPRREQALPTGEYHAEAALRQPHPGGDWHFRFRSRAGVQLAATSPAALNFGGALRVALWPGEIRAETRPGEEMPVPLAFVSATGHELVGLDRGDGRIAMARIELRALTGKVVARSGSGFG